VTVHPRAIIHTEAARGWGGQEIRVLTEMEALRARGHRVKLAAPADSQIRARAMERGFEVRELDTRKWRYPATVLGLRRWFREERVEVVNPHSSRDGWLAGVAGRWAGVPLLLRSRHIEIDYPNRWTSRLAFARLADHVLTTSDRISGRMVGELGLEPDRVSCVPTGIDLGRFHPGIRGVLHAELGWSTDVPLVGMVSVLRSWKGHEYFIGAARELAVKHPEARFVIVGEGPSRGRVEGWVKESGLGDRIRMLGHREDVPEVLASLTVLVLPSTGHEGVPQIVLQGQAMGLAVVGTQAGGIPQVIRDGETGRLVAARDSQGLAEVLGGLLLDPEERRRLGAGALRVALAEYGLDRMCERLEAIYDRYLGS